MNTENDQYEGIRYRYGCHNKPPAKIEFPLGFIPGSARDHELFKFGTGDWRWRVGEAGNLIIPAKQAGLHLICIEMGYEEQFTFQSELGQLFMRWEDEVSGDVYISRTLKEDCLWKIQRIDPKTWRITPLKCVVR